MIVSSPTDCTTPCATTAVSYSVGGCMGTTYSVSITNPNGAIISASAGTVTATAIINIPVGVNVTLTATATGCTPQVVTINAPVCCNLTQPVLSLVSQPTCSLSTGSFTITNYNATYFYTVNPSVGVTIVGNTITAPAGSYTVSAASGACMSPISLPIMLNATTDSMCASIALIKTAHLNDLNNDGLAQIGEVISYNFIITNTGTVPLTNITINDPLPGVIVNGGPISLNVGGVNTTSFTAFYTLTVQDITNGSVTNQATVYGTSPTGFIVHDLSDSTSNTSDGGTVLGVEGCKVEVFNAVTPNNDGDNDFLYIRGLALLIILQSILLILTV